MFTQLCVLLAMSLAAAPRLYGAAFGRRGRGARLVLGGGLMMLSVGQLLSLPPVTDRVDAISSDGVAKVTYNLATILGLFMLICFLGRATGSAPMRRFLLGHGGIFVATAGATVGLMLATPPGLRHHSLQSSFIGLPQVALFYIGLNAYFVYAYVEVGWRTWRYLGKAGRRVSPLMRLSLRVTGLAAAGLAVTALARASWVARKSMGASAADWFNWANWQLSNVAFLLLAGGLSLLVAADIAGAVQALRRRAQRHRDTATLWAELRRSFPEIELVWWWPAGRFRRRSIECLDGLTRLGPGIGASAASADLSGCAMSELARHVWTALRLEPDPRRGSFPTAELPFHPDSGWTEVAGQLAALSVALRAHQLEQAAV